MERNPPLVSKVRLIEAEAKGTGIFNAENAEIRRGTQTFDRKILKQKNGKRNGF
jgi:hypothetical protein